ncbi:MAG TPA: large conductance mechanosensitive channel protein MscL [Acidimicrobiales bacterium]
MAEEKKKGVITEFKEFILRGNVVDLAVAVVIGAAFTAVVTSMVNNIFTPLIAAVFGKPDFSDITFEINGSTFGIGLFINSLIAFLLIALVIFFVVIKPLNYMTERRRKGLDADDSDERPCPECLSEIPKEATRCRYCTSEVPPIAA